MSEISAKLLNARELAKALSVCPTQITRWLQGGVIPAEIREGRCIRFDLQTVRDALAKRASKLSRKKNLPPAAGTAEGLSTK